MSEYSYSYDEECYHGRFPSPEAAALEVFTDDTDRDVIWVGEIKDTAAHDFIDADDVFEAAMCRASDECGECSEDWLATLSRDKAKRAELEKMIGDWLHENEPPTFFTIDNARKITREEIVAAGLLATERLVETLKQQAQIHAMEARTANAIIAEIYQLCTGASGEPGNWNGAEPVRKLVAELEACRKDAERYRWLRDKWWFCGPEQGIRQALCPVELDSAIDAAMAAIE